MKIAYANDKWTKAQKQARAQIYRPGETLLKDNGPMQQAFERMLMGSKGKEVLATLEHNEDAQLARAKAIRFRNDCERKSRYIAH